MLSSKIISMRRVSPVRNRRLITWTKSVCAPASLSSARRAGDDPLRLLAVADRRRKNPAFRPHSQDRSRRLSGARISNRSLAGADNTIRAQTLETLKRPSNPNYETLRAAFDGRFRVSILPILHKSPPPTYRPTPASSSPPCRPCASPTLTDARFMRTTKILNSIFPLFRGTRRDWSASRTAKTRGKSSFHSVVLLAVHRPLVIVDEAHNNTSSLSFEVLQRVNAACVVEFTATPADDSNVLHSVSATELKAEEMIKLPIRLDRTQELGRSRA